MAYLLPHLHTGWEVDQAILTEEDRVVVIRFGRDSDPTCMVSRKMIQFLFNSFFRLMQHIYQHTVGPR
jgi:hypothetical protein